MADATIPDADVFREQVREVFSDQARVVVLNGPHRFAEDARQAGYRFLESGELTLPERRAP